MFAATMEMMEVMIEEFVEQCGISIGGYHLKKKLHLKASSCLSGLNLVAEKIPLFL